MSHQMVPFPERHAFAEVRMVYCERCGATQIVETTGAPRDPLPPCPYEAAYSEGSITVGPRCTCGDVGWPGSCPVHNITITGTMS